VGPRLKMVRSKREQGAGDGQMEISWFPPRRHRAVVLVLVLGGKCVQPSSPRPHVYGSVTRGPRWGWVRLHGPGVSGTRCNPAAGMSVLGATGAVGNWGGAAALGAQPETSGSIVISNSASAPPLA
jgi:hypothetical protein